MGDTGSGTRAAVKRTFANRAAVVVIGAVISVVLARKLGPGGRGEYAVAVTFASTAMVAGTLSLEQALVASWPDRVHRPAIAGAAPQVGLVVAPTAAVLALLAASLIVEPDELGYARLAALGIVPLVLVVYLNAIAVADAEVVLVNRARLLSALLQLVATATLAVAGEITVERVVWIWVAVPVAHAVLLWCGRGWQSSPRWSTSLELVGQGLRYHPGILAAFLLQRVDILILSRSLPSADVGFYALAVTVAELLYVLSDSVAQVTQPSQLTGTMEAAAARTARLVRITAVVAGSAGVLVALTAWFLVPALYGTPFRRAVGSVVLLVPGVVALALTRPLSILLLRHRRPWILTAIRVVALVVDVVILVLLVPPLGIAGAALASTAAYAMQLAMCVYCAHRLSGLAWRALLPRRADLGAVLPARATRGHLPSRPDQEG